MDSEVKTILLADDEKEIVELLELYLEKDGYKILRAYDGEMAYDIVKNNNVDLAVIDIMMPKMDGYQLIRQIRQGFSIPVIVLSAKNTDNDKILGLDLGADDYITKPFNPLEVRARINAQLRRYCELNAINEEDSSITEKLFAGDIVLDKQECKIIIRGEEVAVTSREFKLICFFMEHMDRVFTKKQIFEQVWEEPYYGDDNTIMVHISNIRDKIESDPKKPEYLKTIRGLGYKFDSKRK